MTNTITTLINHYLGMHDHAILKHSDNKIWLECMKCDWRSEGMTYESKKPIGNGIRNVSILRDAS